MPEPLETALRAYMRALYAYDIAWEANGHATMDNLEAAAFTQAEDALSEALLALQEAARLPAARHYWLDMAPNPDLQETYTYTGLEDGLPF